MPSVSTVLSHMGRFHSFFGSSIYIIIYICNCAINGCDIYVFIMFSLSIHSLMNS